MRYAPNVALVALALAACGGSSSSSPPPASTAEHTEGGEAQHQHAFHVLSVREFHTIFAPVFHAEPGEARVTDACAHVSTLHDHAVQIQAVGAPEHVDPAHWQEATTNLVTTVDALATECSSHGAHVEQHLDTVHEAFHRVHDLSEGHDEGAPHHGG